MNVLYIVNSTDSLGGASKSFMTLLAGLGSIGVNRYVITPDKGSLYQEVKKLGVPVIALHYRMNVYPNLRTLKDYLLYLPRLAARRIMERRAVKDIISYCRENKIELIHSNVGLLSCGLSAAKVLQIPHVLHIREYGDKDFGYRLYPSKRAFYKLVKASDSYTISITKGIQEYHNLRGSQCRQIYNGIAVNATTANSEFHGQKYFLYAGRIEVSKAPHQIVEAYSAFREKYPQSDILLKMAGPISDPHYMTVIQDYIKAHGLSEQVSYVGVRKDIGTLMRDAVATIVSSVFEGFGRCLPEAMINDSLTVGRNTGGTKEQYDNGLAYCGQEIGLRYDTTEELTARMIEIYNAPEGYFEPMKAHAKEVVQKLYNKENYVKSVYEFYQYILPS